MKFSMKALSASRDWVGVEPFSDLEAFFVQAVSFCSPPLHEARASRSFPG